MMVIHLKIEENVRYFLKENYLFGIKKFYDFFFDEKNFFEYFFLIFYQ